MCGDYIIGVSISHWLLHTCNEDIISNSRYNLSLIHEALSELIVVDTTLFPT